jgi:hypothetical protein
MLRGGQVGGPPRLGGFWLFYHDISTTEVKLHRVRWIRRSDMARRGVRGLFRGNIKEYFLGNVVELKETCGSQVTKIWQ